MLYISQIKTKDLFGRTKITCSLDEKELNAKNIGLVLRDVLPIHIRNAQQITTLRRIVLGDQAIYSKTKTFRDDINNRIVENHILHAINFKVGYVFDGLQYVQVTNELDEDSLNSNGVEVDITKEINILNSYFRNNDKQSKDAELQQEVYAAGICPRIVVYGTDEETPFEIHNLDGTEAFVVYSSGFKGQRLFSVRLYTKKNYEDQSQTLYIEAVTKKKKFLYELPYQEYHSFDNRKQLSIPTYLPPKEPIQSVNPLGEIPIFEYTFNKDRQSLTEIMLDSQDFLNRLTSSELDDVEQFVQSFIALINVSMNEDTWAEVRKEGLFSFSSDENGSGKADIKVIESNLDYAGTKILYDRVYNIMLTNAGIPLLNTSGGGGDTGIARLTDNGWSMADTKARPDELGFKNSDKPLVKFVISILKKKKLINVLTISGIDIKFSRNKSDNIQTKVQSLKMLIESGIHPRRAIETINLFGDPNEAFTESLAFFGEQYYKNLGLSTSQRNENAETTQTKTDEPKERTEEESELSVK